MSKINPRDLVGLISIILQPSSPSPNMMTSYEQHIKSHLLSKMYLQQYITNNLTKPFLLPNQTADEHETETASHHSNSDKSQMKQISKESRVFLDGPLDLSTRQTDPISIVSKDSLPQSLKEHLYSQQFPFPPFPPILIQTPPLQFRSHDESPSSMINQ